MKDTGLYRQGRLADPKYRKKLQKLAATHTAKELCEILSVPGSSLTLHLRKLGLSAKYSRPQPFTPEDVHLVQELLNANFSTKDIAEKFDASYTTARDFISRNELAVELHPSLENIPKTSYTALQKKENPEHPILRVVPLREANRVVIHEDEYIKLWEKAHENRIAQ